jgi:hypothetical protein
MRDDPFYSLDERWRGGWASGDTSRVPSASAARGHAGITFGDLDDRLRFTAPTDARHANRSGLSRDAVFASVAWDSLDPRDEVRQSVAPGRLRLHRPRGTVGAVRAMAVRRVERDVAALPKFLLGGASTLRGYRAGASRDNLMAATAEIRIPLTSPLGVSAVGLNFLATSAFGLRSRNGPLGHALPRRRWRRLLHCRVISS